MAADTIVRKGGDVKIGGARVSRRALYVAGAVGLGVVGYAWWTRKPPGPAPEDIVTKDQLDSMGDEPVPQVAVPYDPNMGPQSPSGITDNAQWTQFATDRLSTLGYDPIAVGNALGLFLNRRPLNPTDANIARAALAQAGEPPQGRPWSVLTETAPASVGLTAPAGFKATLTGWRGGTPIYRLSWSPVSGAKDYSIQHVGGGSAFTPNTSWENNGSPAGRPDHWRVQARNAANVLGPASDVTFTAATPSSGGGGGGTAPATGHPPANPANVGALPTGPGRVGLSWPAVPGATHYRYRWETSSRASGWTDTNTTRVNATWKFARGTTFRARVQAGNSAGWSPQGTLSNLARAL